MDSHRASVGRSLNIGLAVVVGVSLVGFVIGIRPAAGPEIAPGVAAASVRDGKREPAVPSQPYLKLRQRLYGANSEVTSNLATLRAGLPRLTDKVEQTEADRAQALAQRTKRRAFAGAPPTVPHPIDEKGVTVCLDCHRHGLVLEGRIAPAMSHALLVSCTQCHAPVPEVDKPTAPAFVVDNAFIGGGPAGKGARAWQGAPPAVPHPTWMRQRCSACHGVGGPKGLRTAHPARTNCAQCHAAGGFSPLPRH